MTDRCTIATGCCDCSACLAIAIEMDEEHRRYHHERRKRELEEERRFWADPPDPPLH